MTPATSRKACLCLCCITLLARAAEPPAGKPSVPLVPSAPPAQAANPRENLEEEATKLLNDLPTLTDPGTTAADGPAQTVQQARTRLLQTQKKMLRWEKLLKDGVLSQSEVERCTVELAEALARYEHANLDEMRRQLASAQERVAAGSADQTLVDASKASINSAQASASRADAQLFQTKYDLAKINLERQRRLFAEKLISKAALLAAEEMVQRLEEQKAAKGTEAAPGALPLSPAPPSAK
jgi:multidrug resistance efflux pump